MALESVTLFQKAILLIVILSAPALIAAVIFGVLTALIQTLVQVQDQTLPFVVKLISVGIALFATGGWIAGEMMSLTNTTFLQIQHIGTY